jgi:predicted transcriptional regulator
LGRGPTSASPRFSPIRPLNIIAPTSSPLLVTHDQAGQAVEPGVDNYNLKLQHRTMSKLVGDLFQAPARTAVLHLLLQVGVTASMRELALRCDLSPQAVRKEIEHLERLGLVTTKVRGASKLVTANWDHPANPHLLALLAFDAEPKRTVTDPEVRESLIAYGAPLLGGHPETHWPLEETLAHALQLARRDATVMRVLPVVLAKNRHRFDREALVGLARDHKVKAELGMLLELTGDLLGDRSLKEMADGLYDGRCRRWRAFPETKNRFEAELAKRNTFPIAARWYLRTTMTEDSFRSILGKHCPNLMHA